jgi:hypothetical protein
LIGLRFQKAWILVHFLMSDFAIASKLFSAGYLNSNVRA